MAAVRKVHKVKKQKKKVDDEVDENTRKSVQQG